ncbi:MAG TPA: LysR family transcriptional regulator [Actinomycetota bacterium]|nr:LysR family transcriptional regulator [Actinomycetota bacterium]
MTLGQLRTFVEVARARSISGAAAALVVTEPSVSAAVAALKRDLGVELVERAGRGIRLTAAGEELARYAAQILGLSDRAVRAVREAAGGSRHLRVVGVTTAGEYVLPRLVAQFRDRHPDVQVSLEVGNRVTVIARLLDRDADLAIGGRPPPGSEIAGEALLDNHLVVVGRADHPLAARRAIRAQVIAQETWLLREPGSGTRETTEEFWAASAIEPTSVMTVGSNGAIKQAASVGLGVTLLSLDAVANEIDAGTLSLLPVAGTPLERPWHVLYVRDSPLPPSAQLFLELMRMQPLT